MALDWQHVDLGAGVIRVERSFDPKAGVYVTPKSRAGTRKVPIASVLREYLIAHKLRAGRSDGLVFATSTGDAVRRLGDEGARGQGLARRCARRRSACTSPPHLRLADDRRRREREGARDLHGPRLASRSRSTATAT